MEYNVKVRRYDPSTDGQSHMQSYTLDIEEDASVLDALMRIREEQDSTLAFRGACRSGFCGDCTMRISRRNRIACCTSMSQALRDDEITVEPIRLINVAKDMMFDMGAMVYDKYRAVEPWIEPAEPLPQREHVVHNEVIQDLRKVMSCTMCWLGDEGCTTMVVDRKFLGPAALTKAYRVVADPRDSRTEERLQKLSGADGVWDCCHCFEATEHCPKGIDPTERIFALRNRSIKAGAGNYRVRGHYKSFAGLGQEGRLADETRLAIDTEGGFTHFWAQLKAVALGVQGVQTGQNAQALFPAPQEARRRQNQDDFPKVGGQEIMAYAFYPGCVSKGGCPELYPRR